MTSIRAKYANEIAEAMAKTLGDKEFSDVFKKEAFITKKAEECECIENLLAEEEILEPKGCPLCEAETETEVCPMCSKEIVAAEFTINHLVKIADALDMRGFKKLADMIDKTAKNIARK